MTNTVTALLVTLVGVVGTAALGAFGWLIKSSRNEITRRLDVMELKLSSLDIRVTRVGSAVEFLFPPPFGAGRRFTDRLIDDDGPTS